MEMFEKIELLSCVLTSTAFFNHIGSMNEDKTTRDADEMSIDPSFWKIFAEWLRQQGASTVLLTGLLLFHAYDSIYVEPNRQEQAQKRLDSVGDRHEKIANGVSASHDRDREYWWKDRDAANQIILKDLIRRGVVHDPGGSAQ